jgi:hypothetical protein
MDFIINGHIHHFIIKGEKIDKKDIDNYYTYPVDPGIEILLDIGLTQYSSILLGIDFSWGRLTTEIMNKGYYRAKFTEYSFPILLRTNFLKEFLFTSGFYFGWLYKGHYEGYHPCFSRWDVYPVKYDFGLYDDQHFILDFYLDVGKINIISKNQIVLISPFIKYKLDDYWMRNFRSKIQYGIKFSYILKR